MNYHGVLVFLLDFLSMAIAKKAPAFTLNDLGNAFALAKDANSKIINVKSHMDCMYKCAVRKSCNLFSSNKVPKSLLSSTGYKCGLTNDPEVYVKLYNTSITCDIAANYITKVPKAIAGVCSHHTCNNDQVCTPKAGGGYKCNRERGRRKPRKPRKS